jgi:alpha-glucosidase
MPWHLPESWDARTLSHYRDLIALRHAGPALRRGGLRWLHAGADALTYARDGRDETVLVLARRAPGPPVDLPGIPAATNVYGGAPDLVPDRSGTVSLPGDGPTFQVWVTG